MEDKIPVDRGRRANFATRSVGFCLGVAALFSAAAGLDIFASNIELVKTVIDGLIGYAMAIGVAYIGGSVVDYNGGFGKLFGSDKQPPIKEFIPVPVPVTPPKQDNGTPISVDPRQSMG